MDYAHIFTVLEAITEHYAVTVLRMKGREVGGKRGERFSFCQQHGAGWTGLLIGDLISA